MGKTFRRPARIELDDTYSWNEYILEGSISLLATKRESDKRRRKNAEVGGSDELAYEDRDKYLTLIAFND